MPTIPPGARNSGGSRPPSRGMPPPPTDPENFLPENTPWDLDTAPADRFVALQNRANQLEQRLLTTLKNKQEQPVFDVVAVAPPVKAYSHDLDEMNLFLNDLTSSCPVLSEPRLWGDLHAIADDAEARGCAVTAYQVRHFTETPNRIPLATYTHPCYGKSYFRTYGQPLVQRRNSLYQRGDMAGVGGCQAQLDQLEAQCAWKNWTKYDVTSRPIDQEFLAAIRIFKTIQNVVSQSLFDRTGTNEQRVRLRTKWASGEDTVKLVSGSGFGSEKVIPLVEELFTRLQVNLAGMVNKAQIVKYYGIASTWDYEDESPYLGYS